jgi:uncharacterized protein (TIGR03437 family)
MRTLVVTGLAFFACTAAQPQALSNATLSGKYFFRHVQFTTDASNNVTDARSATGSLTFNSVGNYSVSGQQVIGTGGANPFSVSGTYSLSASGVLTLNNPQKPGLTLNARYSPEAVIGSSTDSSENTFDLFIAIPAPATTQSSASLKGSFFASNLELTAATTAQARDFSLAATFDGSGAVSSLSGRGHAANNASGAIVAQTLTGATYTLGADGSGTLNVPAATPTLLSGGKTLYLSATGNLFLAVTPAAHDMMIGVKAISGTATNASLAGRYWQAGLRVDTASGSQSYSGSGVVIASHTALNVSRRSHLLGTTGPVNYTGSLPFTVGSDGSGSIGVSRIGLGAAGSFFTAANVSTLDPTAYEVSLAIPIPTVTGTGVFLNPQGVVNAASNAPGVDAISPGEFLALYGSGLAASTSVATPPYPASLNGVSVSINGLPAPVYLVSSGQINCLVPYALTGSSATILVTNNGAASNSVTVPLSKTSPGIFSADTSGDGDGIVVHLSGALVNAAAPAKKGETLVMYLTGLGALTSPLPDGTGSPGANAAAAAVTVFVNGVAAPTTNFYAGAGVQFPGLYQINFTVPANLATTGSVPLAIQTPDSFHDQISLAVQ